MTNTLKLVLTDHWFDEIKSGRKTHEYRIAKPFWIKRLSKPYQSVQFQKAYRKNAETMTFKINNITKLSTGINTDLKTKEPTFDITLGEKEN